jgi:hypothetical protein
MLVLTGDDSDEKHGKAPEEHHQRIAEAPHRSRTRRRIRLRRHGNSFPLVVEAAMGVTAP